MTMLVSPAEAAALWYSKELDRHVHHAEIVFLEQGPRPCSAPTGSGKLCMRDARHPGGHRDFIHIDDQGRRWDLAD